MKRSKKVTIGIIIFFILIATVIGGRTAMGFYFKKKFGKRPPPGVIIESVSEKKFSRLEKYINENKDNMSIADYNMNKFLFLLSSKQLTKYNFELNKCYNFFEKFQACLIAKNN